MKYYLSPLLAFFALFIVQCSVSAPAGKTISATHPLIKYTGRIDFTNPSEPQFAYSGVSIKAAFTGTACSVKLNNYSEKNEKGELLYNFYNIFLDGNLQVIKVENGKHTINIGKNLKDTIHTLLIFKRTEAFCGIGGFEGLVIDKGKDLVKVKGTPAHSIEFIGNSITCGYGNEGADKNCPFSPETENNYLAYGAITARNLDADYTAICYSGKGVIRNYDKSYDNPMPVLYPGIMPQKPELQWDFTIHIPDIVVINLGTNDFAHENPDSTDFVDAYKNLLLTVRKNYPSAKIFCIAGPMINNNYPVGTNAKTTCIAFINSAMKSAALKDVFFFEMKSQGRYGFGCDWHPNVKQHEINAAELTAFIQSKI